MVMDIDKKIQILDITITITLFIIGCFARKRMMEYYSDTWMGFNGPAIQYLLWASLCGIT